MITRDQKQLIEVTIKGDAQWEKNYVYYDGDKERETETEDAEHTLYYIDDGGTWKLSLDLVKYELEKEETKCFAKSVERNWKME